MFYALSFPHVRISLCPVWFLPFLWIPISATTAFILWLGCQGFIMIQQLGGTTNVSALGHLGGVACGFVIWLFAYAWGARSG